MLQRPIAEMTVEELRRELTRRNREYSSIRKISQELSSKLSLNELVIDTLDISMQAVNAGAGSLIMYDPKKQKLVFKYVVGPAKEKLTGFEMDPDKGICGGVFQSGKALISDDVTQDKRHVSSVGQSVAYITKNMVTVPMINIEGKCVGVMQILNKADENFDEEDVELLTLMGQQAGAALENARLHEEAKLAVVVNLMGDISHDIKNLITPVQTCTQTLQMLFEGFFADADTIIADSPNGGSPEAIQKLQEAWDFLRSFYPEAIDMIIDGCTATQERVREIADCVKGIVAKPMFEYVNMNDIIEKAVKPLKMVGEKRQVKVTHEAGDIPLTMIDQKQLYNAAYNLVNNAIPETPDGGSVTAKTYAKLDGEFPDGNYIMFEVADTGRGMPEKVRKRLFTEDAVSTKPGGTGLGTKIVKNVVDAHKGKITVDSEEGKGTRFLMRIPICDVAPVTADEET